MNPFTRLHLLKECMLRHIRSQGLAQNSMDFYEEEELEHQTGPLLRRHRLSRDSRLRRADATRRHRLTVRAATFTSAHVKGNERKIFSYSSSSDVNPRRGEASPQ